MDCFTAPRAHVRNSSPTHGSTVATPPDNGSRHPGRAARTASAVAVVALASTLAGAAGRTPDWEQWRGPNRDGISTDKGLLKSWPSGGPKQVWRASGIGTGYATCVVGGGMVFTAGKRDANLAITAFDMDGRQAWQIEHGPAWTKNYEGSRGTPTYNNGKLYQLSGVGLLACYDARSGKRIWSVDITREFGGRPANWGYAESPLVTGSMVVVTPGGSKCIVALNKDTGQPIWTSSGLSDGAHYSSCIAFTFENVPMIATLTADAMVCVSAVNGKFLWRNDRAAGQTAVCPSPVYSNGYVFGASGYGNGGACVKLGVSGGTVSATQAWETKDMASHHGGYVIVGEHIYGYDDNGRAWTCLELATGRKVWTDRGVGKGSVCYADGMLYTFSEDGGRAGLVPATPTGYSMTGEVRVSGNEKSWAHPVVAGGRLYLRFSDALYVFDVADPAYKDPEPAKPKATQTTRPAPKPEPSFRRPPAEPAAETPEAKANRLLTLARNFIANGARETAKLKLKELIKEYPDTDAAGKARELLEDL